MNFIHRSARSALRDSIKRKCIGYWRLNESSGTGFDALGWLHLTDNNTVTAQAGKVFGSREFDSGNSESLTRATESRADFKDEDFSMCCWVFIPSLSNNYIFMAKDASGQRSWNFLRLHTQNKFRFTVSNDGLNETTSVFSDTFGTMSANTWYWVYAEHDAGNDKIRIGVNNGALDQANHSGGTVVVTADLSIGRHGFGTFMNGRIDEAMLFRGRLNARERTYIYHLGDGRNLKF